MNKFIEDNVEDINNNNYSNLCYNNKNIEGQMLFLQLLRESGIAPFNEGNFDEFKFINILNSIRSTALSTKGENYWIIYKNIIEPEDIKAVVKIAKALGLTPYKIDSNITDIGYIIFNKYANVPVELKGEQLKRSQLTLKDLEEVNI